MLYQVGLVDIEQHNFLQSVVKFTFLNITRKTEKKKKISLLLVHSPNACHSQDLATSKPGAQNTVQIFHGGGRNQETSNIHGCFLRCTLAERWNQKLRQDLSQARSMGGRHPNNVFITRPNTRPTQMFHIKKIHVTHSALTAKLEPVCLCYLLETCKNLQVRTSPTSVVTSVFWG